jgi:hypothetical protein
MPEMINPRLVAGAVALVAGFTMMFLPITAYRLMAGISLSATGPEWEIWLLILGGGLGAGLGRLVHHRLLTRTFGYSEKDEEASWRG